MADELSGKRIAFLVANEGVEQVELTSPWEAVKAARATPTLIAPEKSTVQAVEGDIHPVRRIRRGSRGGRRGRR